MVSGGNGWKGFSVSISLQLLTKPLIAESFKWTSSHSYAARFYNSHAHVSSAKRQSETGKPENQK
jgi:hypothetical protein